MAYLDRDDVPGAVGSAGRGCSAGFAPDSLLEEGGFELMVPPRTERKWEGAGTHQRDLARERTILGSVVAATSLIGHEIAPNRLSRLLPRFTTGGNAIRTVGPRGTRPRLRAELMSRLPKAVPRSGASSRLLDRQIGRLRAVEDHTVKGRFQINSQPSV